MGRANKPVTLTELKNLLLDAYPNPRTLQQVLTELGTMRQGNLNITAFREKIASLAEQLSSFEIRAIQNPTQEAKNAIIRMSENMALNVFMKGVNIEYRNLLIASGPKTLNEAVEKCLTAERNMQSNDNSIFRIYRRENRNNEYPQSSGRNFTGYGNNRNRNIANQNYCNNSNNSSYVNNRVHNNENTYNTNPNSTGTGNNRNARYTNFSNTNTGNRNNNMRNSYNNNRYRNNNRNNQERNHLN